MTDFDADIEKLEDAVRLFAQTMKRPQRWARITAQAGLTIDRPAAMILQSLLLHQPKRLGVQDLALLLAVEPPSITRKTQELEQAGYLRRTPNPQDRRAVSLEVTDAGKKVARKLWKIQRQTMADALESWPTADRRQFISLFERFSQDLASRKDT